MYNKNLYAEKICDKQKTSEAHTNEATIYVLVVTKFEIIGEAKFKPFLYSGLFYLERTI